MTVSKMSVSFDPELAAGVRAAAAEAGESLSAWLADAAARRMRAEAADAFLDEWEAEHGAFTEEELERARKELGIPDPARGAA